MLELRRKVIQHNMCSLALLQSTVQVQTNLSNIQKSCSIYHKNVNFHSQKFVINGVTWGSQKHVLAEAHTQVFHCTSRSVIGVIVPIDFRGKKQLGSTGTSCSVTGINSNSELFLVILTGVQNGFTLKQTEGFFLTGILQKKKNYRNHFGVC